MQSSSVHKRQKLDLQWSFPFDQIPPDIWKYLCVPKVEKGQPLLSLNELVLLSYTCKSMYHVIKNNVPWHRLLKIQESPYRRIANNFRHLFPFKRMIQCFAIPVMCCICLDVQSVVPISWCKDYAFFQPLCLSCWQTRLGAETVYETRHLSVTDAPDSVVKPKLWQPRASSVGMYSKYQEQVYFKSILREFGLEDDMLGSNFLLFLIDILGPTPVVTMEVLQTTIEYAFPFFWYNKML